MTARWSLSAAGLALAAVALPAQGAIAPEELAPGVTLVAGTFVPGHQPDGNSVILRGNKGLVVVDTGRHAEHSDAILAATAGMNRPLVAIINTHWHLDHVSGNPRLRAAAPGLTVYASSAIDGALKGFLAESAKAAEAAIAAGEVPADLVPEVRADIATTANGAALRPDKVVNRSQRLKLGGRTLDVHLARTAATAGDLWLVDTRTRSLLSGDLVTLPAPFLDTACPGGWRAALADISNVRFARLIPGHGPVMSRPDFDRWRRAFDRFIDCAKSSADEADCAQGWTQDLGTMLPGGEQRRATEMTRYYVQVLRANAGRNPNCNLV
ncbi:MBL fold metallo-hydrolase [Sandarakinorhabdus oryzae]|uniref:MBL fold metallo-hydrolase n=1 Tax=Sandarakinorhabdus oryzae TaxID=2675220 RepID=UPI0012E2716C|nr:MBL fold metallo-hydrolase [Sandarakinorhabdus oryzae]